MELIVKVRLKQLKKETLFQAYKREEVLGYCQRCNNYGKNYSCPDFKFDTTSYLEPYNYATIIMTEIDTQPIKAQIDKLEIDNLSSRVFNNYIKDKANEVVDISSVISMYAFNDIKDQMAEKLIEIENHIDNTVGLPPGSCTKCVTCLKQQGKPCIYPETLRYSLEALGFMVSDIYKECFDLELGWSKGELPAAFYTCSALMTKEKISEAIILEKLDGLVLNMAV
jgi:predicted metal-binding protein